MSQAQLVFNQGHWPDDPEKDVQVVLTSESAAILSKIPGMKKWQVPPTMTRGSKAVGVKNGFGEKLFTNKPKKKTKATFKKAKEVKKKTKKDKKDKNSKDPEPLLGDEDETEITEATFKRTQQGRDAIMKQMMELYDLDNKAFPHSPAWTVQGACRMKFQGADKFTWDQIKENSGKAFESMFLEEPKLFFDNFLKKKCIVQNGSFSINRGIKK